MLKIAHHRFRVLGSGFWVRGLGFWVQGLGFRVLGSGFWVLGVETFLGSRWFVPKTKKHTTAVM